VLDELHLFFAVVGAGSGCDVGECLELFRAQSYGVCGAVLFDPPRAFCARDRGNVVALGKHRSLTDLIGELSTRSEDFRVRWAAHNVRTHQTGQKRLHHPAVGDLDLTFEAMELRADPGLTLLVYTAEVGSRTQDALNLLATWSATFEQINDSQAARALESSGGGDLAMRSSATAELSGAFLGTRAGTPPHATD
jgi:hypothetical protein